MMREFHEIILAAAYPELTYTEGFSIALSKHLGSSKHQSLEKIQGDITGIITESQGNALKAGDDKTKLEEKHLPQSVTGLEPEGTPVLELQLDELIMLKYIHTLSKNFYNMTATAKELGKTRATVYKYLENITSIDTPNNQTILRQLVKNDIDIVMLRKFLYKIKGGSTIDISKFIITTGNNKKPLKLTPIQTRGNKKRFKTIMIMENSDKMGMEEAMVEYKGTTRKINADHLYIDDYMRYAAGKPQAELKPKIVKIVIPFYNCEITIFKQKKNIGKPTPITLIIECEDKVIQKNSKTDLDDDILIKAALYAIKHNHISNIALQKKLGISHSKAKHILQVLEKRKIITGYDRKKRSREPLVNEEYVYQIFNT